MAPPIAGGPLDRNRRFAKRCGLEAVESDWTVNRPGRPASRNGGLPGPVCGIFIFLSRSDAGRTSRQASGNQVSTADFFDFIPKYAKYPFESLFNAPFLRKKICIYYDWEKEII
ncbi:MAG: hypothetical protein K8H74_06345 [Notoacmeibacter sp.]|nr:hypothetical protein [Notoacmeibacter sp.]